MVKNGWFPRSTRNRVAMLIGLLSLGLFITWNLMPITEETSYGTEVGTMARMFWPSIYESLLHIDAANLDADEIMSAMATILVTLLAVISFSVVPAWKLWQASALLRIIPAILMLLGFGIVLYFTFKETIDDASDRLILLTISANFFTTAIALLLFKNESFDHPEYSDIPT